MKELREQFPTTWHRIHDLDERWPCLYVEFDTDRPYYPMRATSTYGGIKLPLRPYVLGDYILDGDPAARPPLRAEYFDRGQGWVGDERVLEGPTRNSRGYAYLHGDFLASDFKEDIWFKLGVPPEVSRARWAIASLEMPWIFWLAFALEVILLSYLSGGLAGVFCFGRWRGFAAFGLWNCMTLIGVLCAVQSTHGELGELLRGKGRSFVWAFSLTFLMLTVIARQAVLAWIA